MMFKKSLLSLTMGVALLAAGAAQAQMGSAMSGQESGLHKQEHAQGHKKDGERMHKRHQHRMDKLKQSLKLGSEQAQAWAAFEASMHPQGMQRPDPQAMAKMTTPERLDFMSKMKTQHSASMQSRMDATRIFYASLSNDQKKTFDQETLAFMKDHERGGKHMRKGDHSH